MTIAVDPSADGMRRGPVAAHTAGVSKEAPRTSTASPDVVAVGKRIAYYRRQRSWTQDNLAFAAGISRPSIANLERGRYDAKLSIILDIADALKVDPRLLVSDEADPPDLKLEIAASMRDVPRRKQCNACSRPAKERGLCPAHYRMWRAGDDDLSPDDPIYQHLSADDVAQIRRLYASGQHSYRALARRWDVSHSTIRAVVLNQRHAVQPAGGHTSAGNR